MKKVNTTVTSMLCSLLMVPIAAAQHSPGDILFKRTDGLNVGGDDFTGPLPDNTDQAAPFGTLDDPGSSIIQQIHVETEGGAPAHGISLAGDNFDLAFVWQFYDADGLFSFTENFDDRVQIVITPISGPTNLTPTGGEQTHSDVAWNVRTFANFDFGGGGWYSADVHMTEDGGGAQSAGGIGFGYANSTTSIEGDFGLVGGGATFDQDAANNNWDFGVLIDSFDPNIDSDSDGIPDGYEEQLFPGDLTQLGLGDFDSDGISDPDEYNAGTDPTKSDSDNDGVSDSDEATNGTDPLDPDTDGDGLLDGVETNTGNFVDANNTGTDPNKADTDEDGSSDSTEVSLGFDPNNPLSKPTAADTLWAWWPLNEGSGTIAADISGNGRDAVIVRGDTGGLGPGGAAWIEDPECGMVLSFNGDNASGTYAIMTAPGDQSQYGALPLLTNAADNTFTWSVWIRAEDNQANNDIILGNRNQPGGGDFAPREFIKFDSNNFEFDTNNVTGVDYADIVGDQLGKWVHHVIVKDGASFTYYRDGVEAGTGNVGGSQNNQQPLFFGGQGNFDGSVTTELWRGALFDVRLFTGPLTEGDVLDLFNNKGSFGPPIDRYNFVVSSDDGGSNLDFSWKSSSAEVYTVVSTNDAVNNPDPNTWSAVAGLESLAATPPLNTASIPKPADPGRLYRLVAGPVPPVFYDDFESGAAGWVALVNDASGNTQWELGTPAGTTGPTAGADDSANAYCTNLGDYGDDSDISLRSPVIDLTSVASAELSLDLYRDADGFADNAVIRFLRASDQTPLGADIPVDMTIIDQSWAGIEAPVPAAALGETVILEIQFNSDASADSFSGLSVDNVSISAN